MNRIFSCQILIFSIFLPVIKVWHWNFYILFSPLQNQVVLNLELFDFINRDGLRIDNKKCESTLNFDKCNPEFTICISSGSDEKFIHLLYLLITSLIKLN